MADVVDVIEPSSSTVTPILTFEVVEGGESSIVAVFESWDSAWEESAVAEIWPGVAQIENRLETVPDAFGVPARPTRKDRG